MQRLERDNAKPSVLESLAPNAGMAMLLSENSIGPVARAYSVETIVLPNGERLPLLIGNKYGLPIYDATAFELQMLRGRGLASNTMEQALRAIGILLRFLDHSKIDLNARISEGRILTLGEVEGIARLCHQSCKAMDADLQSVKANHRNVFVIRGSASKSLTIPNQVDKQTTTIRLTYIAQFISWLATNHLQQLAYNHPARPALESSILTVQAATLARRPSSRGTNSKMDRKGLDPAIVARLDLVTIPDNPENPWQSPHVRARNFLIICWLRAHGMRRGELAGLRTSHFNGPMTHVRIVRRADDLKDTRKKQPNAKTRARDFDVLNELTRATREYVLNVRDKIQGAKKHDFVFVANRTGKPLSESAINKAFQTLRKKVKDLPKTLSPHWLRHTWNDDFSETVDLRRRQGHIITDEAEQEMRNWLMGWEPNSKTGLDYTKRHTRAKANELLRDMQDKTEVDDGKIE